MLAPGTLEGVRILDLSRLLPGGFCSLLLADAGADVIKVEDTGMGDYVRWSPPYYGSDDQHALGTRFTHVALRPRVEFDSEVDEATLARLHEGAHERCFIANTVSCPVEVAA